MGKIILYVVGAVCAYLVGGINPAIVMSKLIYHKDIRTLGSKNPGFTNFKRVFGGKYAWLVFALDLLKSALLCVIFGPIFAKVCGSFSLGAAYVALFAMLGHAFPVWYGFMGGKCFSVGAAAVWFVDWRAALIAMAIMMILLFTLKYMSLSVIAAAVSCPVSMLAFGVRPAGVIVLSALSAALLIFRHKANIKRLIKSKENKFNLF